MKRLFTSKYWVPLTVFVLWGWMLLECAGALDGTPEPTSVDTVYVFTGDKIEWYVQ